MWISVGKSRNETHWKNVQINWQELTAKLKKPKLTAETVKQYKALSKEQRDEIKDIGGYVGGTIKGGNRLKNSVECRTLITLEADEDCTGLWESFCLFYDCAAVLHSTHSSTKEHLRARLIIPLSRECFTDEYEAIIRKVADVTGIAYFDYTSFQPSRLMYWPSIPKDAEYIFKEQAGPALQVDEVLKSYRDWRDVSQWPLHPKEKSKRKTELGKQENPLEKSGIIGAFCRAYNIHEAIEKFLPDVYEPTDVEDRYTYKAGSTSGGMIVYDDIFSYSHHSTDRTNETLCNAFDLVRISLYSDLDEGGSDNTPTHKKPSYLRCCELLMKDSKVKKALVSDKLKEAKEDFTGTEQHETDNAGEAKEIDLNEQQDNSSEEWFSKLETDKKGNCYSTANNIVLILQNDKRLKNIFRWDSFNHRITISGNTYWKQIKQPSDTWVDDNDKANIRHYLEKMYAISGKDKINDGLLIVSFKNKFHPVLDYLNGLEWDGINRLDTLLTDYLGAEDNAYTRAVTRKSLVAAIARVKQPGIKFDTMLILVGKQGTGKSTLLKKLGGEWFSDNGGNLHDKSGIEQLRGIWILEMGEMASLKKADVDLIKSYLSRTEDRFRQAYGETISLFPRQNIFIGTTNETQPLVDATGGRRFWPVTTGKQDKTKNVFKITEKERAQIWAEALYYYNQTEPLYLDEEINEIAERIQDEHTEQESLLPAIHLYLNKPIPEEWYKLTPSERFSFLQGDSYDFGEKEQVTLIDRHKISPLEIWVEAIGGRRENFTKAKAKEIKNAMLKIQEWEYKKVKIEGISVWGWARKKSSKNGSKVQFQK